MVIHENFDVALEPVCASVGPLRHKRLVAPALGVRIDALFVLGV